MPKTRSDGRKIPNMLMVGTGEYTTGYTSQGKSQSDKKKGVVGLVLFDQRRLGHVGELSMVGTNGRKFPAIRDHLQRAIGEVYHDMDVSFNSFPADDAVNPEAYRDAISRMQPGDGVIIFTPDETHYSIARTSLEHGLHVLVTKPPVMTLVEHQDLVSLAEGRDLIANVEVHKRWDPNYRNARQEIRRHTPFTDFRSYMAQPKRQLDTFSKWVGQSPTDISYYLNSHHVDWHVWAMEGIARPTKVHASAATGIARAKGYNTEDMITLIVEWVDLKNPSFVGTAVYTAGWVEPESEVHTRQGFDIIAGTTKLQEDQSRRGYWVLSDGKQVESRNPLYMDYEPDEGGFFAGQHGYGYLSIASFVAAIGNVLNGERKVSDMHRTLPTLKRTQQLTAILQAGRMSLNSGLPMEITYADATSIVPVAIQQYGGRK
ncbi:MAG TPA: Gfo/Idh/MocA family oxidoreductase [Candidatus Nanoarchaeia archaeon]|nr:Gfo/Idh/MocA family oxidoreductase [Candidatus Nanoarchaeia archaeon]